MQESNEEMKCPLCGGKMKKEGSIMRCEKCGHIMEAKETK